jgi:uncharacterized MnhB-related membrane protein
VNSFLPLVFLVVVAVSAAPVVLVKDPLQQSFPAMVFGAALAGLFVALGAPDAALAQIAVSGLVSPLFILLALAKIRRTTR